MAKPDPNMEQIYQEYANIVYRYLLAQTRDAALAEELTQETFYQAIRSIDRYDGGCKMSVWLCQIAKHQWYHHLRRQNREQPDPEPWQYAEAAGESAADTVEQKQQQLRLLQNIHRLPEAAREVVYLRAFGGLSFKEIAAVTDKTETWARVTYYRAKETLKGVLKDDGEAGM